VEVISEMLRDPHFRVQMSALDAARTLGDRRLLGALEGTQLSDGRARRAAREVVRTLREGETQTRELAALREEVDRLKEESRQIKERLEAMARPEPRPARAKAAEAAEAAEVAVPKALMPRKKAGGRKPAPKRGGGKRR